MRKYKTRKPWVRTVAVKTLVVELELGPSKPHSLPEGAAPEHLRHGGKIKLRNATGRLVEVFIPGLE